MLRRSPRTLLYILIFCLITVLPLHGFDKTPPVPPVPRVPPLMMSQPPLAPAETGISSSIEKVSAGVFRIGQVTINKNERCITFPAQINMDKGLLEYLLVRNGGKTHESLLRTAVEPYHLQLACLLLGLEGTARPLAFQGAPETPTGDLVEMIIDVVEKGGRSVLIRPEAWLATMQEMKPTPVSDLTLVYTGSMVNEGRFVAQIDGSMIALYHDPVAIIDNASPGGEINNHWVVREGVVPAVGTAVTVTIKPKSRR